MDIDEVRKMSKTDALQAEAAVKQAFHMEDRASVLRQLTQLGASDSRLKHIVARVSLDRPQDRQMVVILEGWLKTEPDEFTKNAIRSALSNASSSSISDLLADPQDLLDIYRYVTDRLRHRIRNAIPSAKMTISLLHEELLAELGPVRGSRLKPMLEQLRSDLQILGRYVEFSEGDDYFVTRLIQLDRWLIQRCRDYASLYADVSFDLDALDDLDVSVSACDYLLDTLFVNAWDNAKQQKSPARISFAVHAASGKLALWLLDNGPGFPEDAANWAFRLPYSSKGADRGRGLFEIWEATSRLGGSVSIRRRPADGHRIHLVLPINGQVK